MRARFVAIGIALLFLVLCVLADAERWANLGEQVIDGLGAGAVFALSGTGLVLAYRATGVFNFAQGGVATLGAFGFYDLTTDEGLPVWLGGLIAVVLLGPAIGCLMELSVFRPLQKRAAGTAERLVANLGVLILLLGIGGVIYGEDTYDPKTIFSNKPAFHIGHGRSQVGVPMSSLGNLTFVVIGGVGLAVLLGYTRLGRQIRAVVDRRTFAELNVVNANRVALISWGMGCGFAALAGVLYTPIAGLQNGTLALTVLETISVAVIARLTNVGAAVAAGLGIGVVQSLGSPLINPHYPSWLPLPGLPDQLLTELPVISTVVFLLIYRGLDEVGVGNAASLVTGAFGRRSGGRKLPNGVRAAGAIVVALIALALPSDQLGTTAEIVAYAVAFLAIVAITGYSGHITLATAAFGGLGAYITTRLSNGYLPLPVSTTIPHVPVVIAMLVAGLLCIPIGLAVGYPALRRRGLILGLFTLAFAQVVDAVIFENPSWTNGGTMVHRPSIGPLDFTGDRGFLFFELVVLALALVLVNNLRSGALGRALGAMRDSEAGSVSVGVPLRRLKLFIFGASAFIAAIGGSLLALQQRALTFNAGGPFSPLSGLYWFGAVVVFGLSYRVSAVLAAVTFVVVDVATGQDGAHLLIIGLLAAAIGYLPGGLIGTSLRLLRNDAPGDRRLSPMQASLSRYTIAWHARRNPPRLGDGLVLTEFGDRILGPGV